MLIAMHGVLAVHTSAIDQNRIFAPHHFHSYCRIFAVEIHPMKLTFYGHATFLIDTGQHKILVDPFISANPLCKHIDPMAIECDFIFLSHGHDDHLLDAEAIARKNNAVIVSNFEVSSWYMEKGLNVHPMNHGGSWNFDFGRVKVTAAVHSSTLPDGSYGGNPAGFIFYLHNKTIYYAGDTALTLDMQLIPLWAKLDYSILPIGDNFTMGYEDASRCAEMVQCPKVIGVHYNTFDPIKLDTAKAAVHFQEKGQQLLLPGIGETIEL